MQAIEREAGLVDAPVDPALVYEFLSALFAREVTAAALSACGGGETAAQLDMLAGAPGMADVAERLHGLSAAPESASRDLAGAFAFLFLGVGARHGAPPYESSWRDPDRLTCRAEEAWMRALLRALDLRVAADFPEPADHVAVQLAAMGALSRRAESDARAAQQAATLSARMAEWLPDFAKACRRGDRTGFYACVAEAAAVFVAADAKARLSARSIIQKSFPPETGVKR